MLAIKYRANKDKAGGQPKVVFMLSTCHQPDMELVNPDSNVLKPTAVKSYNQHMGGADRVDQQLHGLQVLRKSYKWYKKLAFRLVLQVILNAHKIFTKETGSNIPFVHFVLDVITTPDQPQNHRIPQGEDFFRLTGRHFPKLKQPTVGASNQHPSKVCKVCYAKGLRTNKGHPLRTTFVCGDCPSEPGLRADRCFEIYHTKRNYAEDAA